jgi:amino acid adenylation domain-containing protein
MKNESFEPIDSFLGMFNFYVENWPESTALKFNDEALSYGELGVQASRIASALKRKNIQEGTVVGLFFDRSIEMMVAIMGILKAGCAYLPIDTKYPRKRVEHLISDSRIENVLTSGVLASVLGESGFAGKVHLLDDMLGGRDAMFEARPTLFADSTAYVIYTSASTGTSKGVVISHGNLAHFIKAMKSVMPFNQGEVLLMLAPISFDLSISETLLPLASGMTVVIANEEEQKVPETFAKAILRHQVTMIHSTPSRLKAFLTMEDKSWLSSLKVLMVGGEEFPASLFHDIKRLFKKNIYNLYGPTEATVWCTFKDLTNTESLTIGKALPGYRIYVLDQDGQKCDVNAEGEICIGGNGVAQGYINDKRLTGEKFVPDPFYQNSVMYRTGDIGKINSDGELLFLGRVDNQIKVRGYRVDLSEIESKLLKIQGIRDAVVTAAISSVGEKVITAYFVSDNELSISELKESLGKELPDYMLPANFIRLNQIPLTFNGKIDYKSLHATNPAAEVDLIIDEGDEVKAGVTEVWREILSIASPKLDDDFFETGGHSLNAIILINTINQKYNVKFPVIGFLENPTLGHLIDEVRSLSSTHSALKTV